MWISDLCVNVRNGIFSVGFSAYLSRWLTKRRFNWMFFSIFLWRTTKESIWTYFELCGKWLKGISFKIYHKNVICTARNHWNKCESHLKLNFLNLPHEKRSKRWGYDFHLQLSDWHFGRHILRYESINETKTETKP